MILALFIAIVVTVVSTLVAAGLALVARPHLVPLIIATVGAFVVLALAVSVDATS